MPNNWLMMPMVLRNKGVRLLQRNRAYIKHIFTSIPIVCYHFREVTKMTYPHCSAIAAAIPGNVFERSFCDLFPLFAQASSFLIFR